MKLAVLGTRGIPNQYGGYEAFAEKFSVMMVERGHEVTVFNSSSHPYKEKIYKGVEIIHCFDPERWLGPAAQFIYDLHCIRICRDRSFDAILQLGYTSSSVWSFLFPKNCIIATNMDGLEWKRSKYSTPVKKFLKRAEKWAARNSTCLVADNLRIQDYLETNYGAQSVFIPYGAEVFSAPVEKTLKEFGILPYQFNLVVARIEPENNLETIIRGHLGALHQVTLLIVGSLRNKYARQLRQKYSSPGIVFQDSLYETGKLNSLRWFSNLYFHGHSVGGTNPSLLEAMACSALICAHDNVFNRSVLDQDGFYFRNENDISDLLNKATSKHEFESWLANNQEKITEQYNWGEITSQYENLLLAENERRKNI